MEPAWQVLEEACQELWGQLWREFTARHFGNGHEATLRRLGLLTQWLRAGESEAGTIALQALPAFAARLREAQESQARVQCLGDCLRLIREAGGMHARALEFLRERCRRTLADEADEPALRLARCLAALSHEGGVEDDADAVLHCLVALQADAASLLHEQLSRQALVLLDLLRQSTWEPMFAQDHGFDRASRRLQALLDFQGEAAAERWRLWQIDLCAAHLCRSPLALEASMACALWLWRLHYQVVDAAEPVPVVPTVPPVLLPPLSEFVAALAPAPVSAAQLRHGYELAAVASQLECGAIAVALRCLHAILARHWFASLPLSVDVCALLREFCVVLGGTPDNAALWRHLWRMSALWPRATRADLPIPLAGDAGAARGSVRLDAVPVLLAVGLRTLTSVRPEWFASRAAYAMHRADLQRELLLLERGAAAVKVRNVERYCAQLLEFMLRLERRRGHAAFPGALLWRAHQHLVDLLDAAAAWLEAVPDAALMRELSEAGLVVADETPLRVAEPTDEGPEAHWTWFCHELVEHVQAFATALQIRMRLDIDSAMPACPASDLATLHAALLPLLRFLLLDFSLSLEQRRVRHLPLAGCLWLRAFDEGAGLAAELRDDSAREPPPRNQWQELLHRARKNGAAALTCTETPLGRRFTLTLPRT